MHITIQMEEICSAGSYHSTAIEIIVSCCTTNIIHRSFESTTTDSQLSFFDHASTALKSINNNRRAWRITMILELLEFIMHRVLLITDTSR